MYIDIGIDTNKQHRANGGTVNTSNQDKSAISNACF
jgi:hypothetical protein